MIYQNSLNKQNTLKLIHLNIRSIHGNIDKLNNLLFSSNFEPDIISINETKLKPKEDCRIGLAGYNFFTVDLQLMHVELDFSLKAI